MDPIQLAIRDLLVLGYSVEAAPAGRWRVRRGDKDAGADLSQSSVLLLADRARLSVDAAADRDEVLERERRYAKQGRTGPRQPSEPGVVVGVDRATRGRVRHTLI